VCYVRTGDDTLLDEAIVLEREAHTLHPEGHPNHALSCTTLAISLATCYFHNDNKFLLDEAIDLQREALALCPQGHPDHARFRGDLAVSLFTLYKRTSDDGLLHESFMLAHEYRKTKPKRTGWRLSITLCKMHLQRNSSLYNVKKVIQCLSHNFQYQFDDVSLAVSLFLSCINDIWSHDRENKHDEFTDIYQHIINLLPLLANSALDIQPQLLALKACSRIGSNAFVSAALADKSMIGLELLELAQGVIWSQNLYLRDPQLTDIPDSLATKLESHLQALAVRSTTEAFNTAQDTALGSQDMLHRHSFRAYALIREIRPLPGLHHFMLGESFETLCSTAASHPVVVLVGARGRYYALVIALAQPYGHALISLDLTEEDLESLSYTPSPSGARRCAVAPDDVPPKVERAQFNKSARSYSGPFDGQLKTLWHKVVKPVLECLGLKASEFNHDDVSKTCADDKRSHLRTTLVHACIGVLLVYSANYRYMQRVSMTESRRCAAVTLWCHHTPLL
jgi:hypothetical protein